MNILMVCLGNICRSPMAEGILRHKLSKRNIDWVVDSAGTSGWHDGDLPDHRGMQLLRQKGIDISKQRSRKIELKDFDQFDLILVMDKSNYTNVMQLAPNQKAKDKVRMILDYSSSAANESVPDPYYDNGFEFVYDLLDEACERLIISHLEND